MITQNKREFEVCNIPLWWKRGYTGIGINIAEIEDADPSLWFFDEKLKDPFDESDGKRDWNSHGQKVLDVMHQVAPDAMLYILPSGGNYSTDKIKGNLVEKSIPYAEENNIHIIGASLGGTDNDLLNKRILEAQNKGVVFVTSAGNKGDKGLSGYAKSNVWISVGAIHLYRSELRRAKYSSIGENIDFAVFSNLYVHNANKKGHYFPMQGTSFSSPMFCGMLALVQQFFLEKTGRTLYQNEIYKFVKDNAKDLGELGFDAEYGHGLFVLPDPDKIDVNKYLLRGGAEMSTKDFFTDDDGKWFEDTMNEMASLGIIKGYTDDTIRGDQPITRAEAVVIAKRVRDDIIERLKAKGIYL